MSEMVIFEEDARVVEVRLEGGTLWATQSKMAELFDTSTDNIGLHLKDVYAEAELDEVATTGDFSVVREEGSRQVRRRLKHYNPDAVISVGYRVNSGRAIRFRQWATRMLREHLTQGYSLNEHRIAQRILMKIEQFVDEPKAATPKETLIKTRQRVEERCRSGFQPDRSGAYECRAGSPTYRTPDNQRFPKDLLGVLQKWRLASEARLRQLGPGLAA